MKEMEDLTPLILGILAALTLALLTAEAGAKVLTLLYRPQHERRRGGHARTSRR